MTGLQLVVCCCIGGVFGSGLILICYRLEWWSPHPLLVAAVRLGVIGVGFRLLCVFLFLFPFLVGFSSTFWLELVDDCAFSLVPT